LVILLPPGVPSKQYPSSPIEQPETPKPPIIIDEVDPLILLYSEPIIVELLTPKLRLQTPPKILEFSEDRISLLDPPDIDEFIV
jgi:hypothetical protein